MFKFTHNIVHKDGTLEPCQIVYFPLNEEYLDKHEKWLNRNSRLIKDLIDPKLSEPVIIKHSKKLSDMDLIVNATSECHKEVNVMWKEQIHKAGILEKVKLTEIEERINVLNKKFCAFENSTKKAFKELTKERIKYNLLLCRLNKHKLEYNEQMVMVETEPKKYIEVKMKYLKKN